MRVHLEERVAVAAPPEAVFAAVADWEAQSEWVALTRVSADGGPHRVGERLVAVTGLAGLGFAVVGPAFRRMLRRSLRRLARMVEADPGRRTGAG